jgi:hypothetical protein
MAISSKVNDGLRTQFFICYGTGLTGDRANAVVVDNQTGKVATAKNPRKWGKLFDFRSMYVD